MDKNKKEKIVLAKETLEKYKQEYEHLINEERPAVQAALKEARAQGDLSENAEYDAARDKQAVVENRILELEAILENAVVIDNTDDAKVGFQKAGIGATVTYRNLSTDDIKTITIMGVLDSNPMENKISNKSPLAQALMDTSIGGKVEVDIADKYWVEILDIEYR